MVSIKKIIMNIVLIVPFVLSICAIFMKNNIVAIIAVFSVFVAVGIVPKCKYNETLWTFLITSITTVPLEAYYVNWIVKDFFEFSVILRITYGVLMFFVVFSIIEIVMLVISRLIWRRQWDYDDNRYEET